MKLDPRLKKFKENEKRKKEAGKIAQEKAKENELAAAKKAEENAKLKEVSNHKLAHSQRF